MSLVKLYKRLFIIAVKRRLVFRANYFIDIGFGFLYIFLQIAIWKGLYKNSPEWNGIVLFEMVSYTLLSSFTQMIVKSSLMRDINNSFQNGSFVMQLLIPQGFIKYHFLLRLSDNLVMSLYKSLPPIVIAIIVFGMRFSFSWLQLICYVVMTLISFCLHFTYSMIMGLSVFWFKNSFFLDNVDELIFKVFSGAIVPFWFFPKWLQSVSYYFPFRLMVFEPIAMLMGKTSLSNFHRIILVQLVWLVLLSIIMCIVWKSCQKRLLVQGG